MATPPASPAPPAAPEPPVTGGPLVQALVWIGKIRTWTQASIVLVLGGALAIGTVVYRSPQRTFEILEAVVLHEPPPRGYYLNQLKSELQREADNLLATFGGPNAMVAVSVWAVDLPSNRAQFVRGAAFADYAEQFARQQEGRLKWAVPVFSDNAARNHIVGQLYLGRLVCAPPLDWPIITAGIQVAEICLCPIPPEGFGLVGMVVGLWHRPIAIDDRPAIEAAFRAAASNLLWQRHG